MSTRGPGSFSDVLTVSAAGLGLLDPHPRSLPLISAESQVTLLAESFSQPSQQHPLDLLC